MNINLDIDLSSLAFWAGFPSALFLIRYAYQVFTRKAQPTGFATFLMWTILDVLLLFNTIRNGQPVWLPLGWTVGAGAATIALGIRGIWQWTWRESLSLICATVATIISVLLNGSWGLVASIAAMIAAGTPILIDNIRNPIRETFMIWFVTVVGCVLSLLGSDWSFDGTILPTSSLVYNGAMSIIVLRKAKRVAYATA